MEFEFSAEQKRVNDICKTLALEKFAKRANTHDASGTTPIDNLKDLFEAGMLSLTISKDLGGGGSGLMGEDPLLYLLAVEQTARGCLSTAQCLHIHCHGAHMVDQECSPAQRKNMLGDVIENGALLNATGSEPGRTARGLYKLITTAKRVPNGYVLNGLKNYATLGAEAKYNVVFAGTEGADPIEGHICVAIPRGSDGLSVVDNSWSPLGMRAASSPTLKLDNCFVSDDYVVGTPGFYPKKRWQARFHLSFSAQYLGACESIFDALVDYLPKRGTAQDSYTQLRMGEIRAGTDSVRWLMYRAAWLWKQSDIQNAELFSMVAKHRAIENAVIVMDKAAQIAGSSAFMDGAPLNRIYRDLRIHTLHENLDKTAATIGRYHLGQEFDTTARL
ncbi:MAG: acyl-CoA/acyl-ACP dehydrogenase [Pseudolabrys sp.]|nr:acyl-CoA/acyl-ACP dehydrogenase [Pseudolabrys sp.]